jgi:spermidine/putrescine transport system permease protein
MRRSRLCLIITFLAFAFLYLPVLILVINSFNASRFGGKWAGFSLIWYQQLFQDKEMWLALENSLIIGITSATASVILGTSAALALYRYKSSLQKVHYSLIYAPLVIPDILMGISLLLFFSAINISLGLGTIFIAHTTFCVSYVTMIMLAKLQNFDFSLAEAAQDLGANNWKVFRRVILPLLSPGIIAAVLLSFTMSIDDFVITFFVAGEGVTTLPLYIYSMIRTSSTPIVNALSTLILIGSCLSVWIVQLFSKDEFL